MPAQTAVIDRHKIYCYSASDKAFLMAYLVMGTPVIFLSFNHFSADAHGS